MKDQRLEEARRLYSEQQPLLAAFKTNVELSLKMVLAERGVTATVTGRVKSLDSILKKLIRKPDHTFDILSDKVGLRIITNDVQEVCAAIRSRFTCLAEEDKSAALGPDRLGYPGIHFDVELPPKTKVIDSVRVNLQRQNLCLLVEISWQQRPGSPTLPDVPGVRGEGGVG